SSAMAFTSSGCSLQKSAIWSNDSAVFSTNQTAVAFGIRGWVAMINSPCAPPARRGEAFAIEDDGNSRYIGALHRLAQPPTPKKILANKNKFRNAAAAPLRRRSQRFRHPIHRLQ